jgi:hypothetical protein
MSEEDAALQLEKERTARLAAIVSKLKEATEAADPSSLKTNLRMLQDIMVSIHRHLHMVIDIQACVFALLYNIPFTHASCSCTLALLMFFFSLCCLLPFVSWAYRNARIHVIFCPPLLF